MPLIALNCPNCSAPLQIGERVRSARCSYCATNFIPNPAIPDAQRATLAVERNASELALKRLHFEGRDADQQLQQEVNRHFIAEEQAAKSVAAQRDLRLSRVERKYELLRQARNGILSIAFLGTFGFWILDNLWSFGDWGRGWTVAILGLLVGAVLQVVVWGLGMEVRSAKKPGPAFVAPPRVPTDEEKRLWAMRARIDAETVRHKQVVRGKSNDE